MTLGTACVIVRHLSGSKHDTIQRFELNGLQEITIGRDPRCDVAYDVSIDDVVSRKHAVIHITNGALFFRIVDLGSSNGTFVNGKRISEIELCAEDIIELGAGGPKFIFDVQPRPATLTKRSERTCPPAMASIRASESEKNAVAQEALQPKGFCEGSTVFAEASVAPSSRALAAEPMLAARRDSVEFGITAPATLEREVPAAFDAWMFRREDFENVRDRVERRRPLHALETGGAASIARGSLITVRLKISNCKVKPGSQVFTWDGSITNASFVVVPSAQSAGSVVGTCTFSIEGIKIGRIAFAVPIAKNKGDAERSMIGRPSVQHAFISYASKDRRRVLARVQGLQKLAIEVFMDVRNLHSNDPYPTELLKQIDAADILYLFWSRHAKASSWVEREWRYALERKGAQFVDPVPLVDPRKVPPPPELGDTKHFNDWVLAYIEYEKALNPWERMRSWLAGD